MSESNSDSKFEKLLIYSPVPADSTRGNQITALRWAQMFRELGYVVTVVDPREYDTVDGSKIDVVIALHAGRSSAVIEEFHRRYPKTRIIVVLTGTDLHGDLPSGTGRANRVIDSLEIADQIVLLEPEGQKLLRPDLQEKSTVIYQSAAPVVNPPGKNQDRFVVTVIGNLRPVKDPFLTSLSTSFLPRDSKIKIIHIGEALGNEMKLQAERETIENSRYEWIGAVSHDQAQRQLAESHLTVNSSILEGAPSVISEAVVNGVPVLATRIHASIGLLGAGYAGLFPVGDARRLADLLSRAETDPVFYSQLKSELESVSYRFDRSREKAQLKELLETTPFIQ